MIYNLPFNYNTVLFNSLHPWLKYILVTLLIFFILLSIFQYIKRRISIKRSLNVIFLLIQVPRQEDRKDEENKPVDKDFKETVSVMEQLLAGIYSIHKGKLKNKLFGEEHISFEYSIYNNEIYFHVIVPKNLSVIIEKQITAYYPDAYIEQVKDTNIFSENSKQAATSLITKKNYHLPIKTYKNLESDPLNNLTNIFSKLPESAGATIQICLSPTHDKWMKKAKTHATNLHTGKSNSFSLLGFFSEIFREIFHGSNTKDTNSNHKMAPGDEEKAKAIQEKSGKVGFKTIIRIITSAKTKEEAEVHLNQILSAFSQFNNPELNAFKPQKFISKKSIIKNYLFKNFKTIFNRGGKPFILNTEEIASIFHLPSARYNKAPNIHWQPYKLALAPNNIPKEGLYLGDNIYRGEKKPIFMTNADRFRHFYLIGQTGTGKSSALINMIRQDLTNGNGLCVIDPHGDLAETIMNYVPKSRADDVIYFNPSDTERPLGVNLLEADTPEEKDYIALEAMNIMIKLYGEEIFSPRLQDYFRNGCLTLMDDEVNGGAITDVVRLFTDDSWQQFKVSKVKNPIVRSFWEKQMASTGAREKQEMIPYFASKFGAFVTNTLMRNIIGQTKSSFDFSDVMNNNKILLVNLSKGAIGDINSKLLGMIIVTKLQVAAMRRTNIPKEERKDFFLYIDEFQNFVTESIETILSEARKYRLSLNIAHQFVSQLTKGDKDTKIRDAVFGNVGTMMYYKVGASDTEYLIKEMRPVFSETDLLNLDAFKAMMKLSINNQPSRPFSITIPKYWETGKKGNLKLAKALKQLSRLKYGRDRNIVSREILYRIGA